MKKLTTIKLFLVLLFVIPVLFTKCSEKSTIEDTVFKVGMPIYQILEDQHPVDSIKRLIANNIAMEVVYFEDGRVVPYYNFMNIRNLALRELYSEYHNLYGILATRMVKYYKPNDVNYILFNAYLVSKELPILTKIEYNMNIITKSQTLRGPPKDSFSTEVTKVVLAILFGISVLLILARFLDKRFNLVKPYIKKNELNDS